MVKLVPILALLAAAAADEECGRARPRRYRLIQTHAVTGVTSEQIVVGDHVFSRDGCIQVWRDHESVAVACGNVSVVEVP